MNAESIRSYTKRELKNLPTLEQAWDGDELKVDDGTVRVWLTLPENRQYNGDYTIEVFMNGRWIQSSQNFPI